MKKYKILKPFKIGLIPFQKNEIFEIYTELMNGIKYKINKSKDLSFYFKISNKELSKLIKLKKIIEI